MSNLQSKLPNMKEATEMATKLYRDVKTSVCEIIDMYKEKRSVTEEAGDEMSPKEATSDAAPKKTTSAKKTDTKAEEKK